MAEGSILERKSDDEFPFSWGRLEPLGKRQKEFVPQSGTKAVRPSEPEASESARDEGQLTSAEEQGSNFILHEKQPTALFDYPFYVPVFSP